MFLGTGARGLLDGRTWPVPIGTTPAAWLEGDERFPVRGYPLAELPHWLDDELWEVELDGTITPGDHSLTAARGRLIRRVGDWDASSAWAFVEEAVARTRMLATRVLEAYGHSTQAAAIVASSLDQLVAVCHAAAATLDGLPAELAAYPADCLRYADEAQSHGAAAAVAGYIAAHATGRLADDYDVGAGGERAWQARWLATALNLGDREPAA